MLYCVKLNTSKRSKNSLTIVIQTEMVMIWLSVSVDKRNTESNIVLRITLHEMEPLYFTPLLLFPKIVHLTWAQHYEPIDFVSEKQININGWPVGVVYIHCCLMMIIVHVLMVGKYQANLDWSEGNVLSSSEDCSS